jgi:DNA-binding transcriptional LysR family regulator
MEMRTVQYFIEVAEHLSFSAAAAKLGLSQSAISRQVGLLEAELGVQVFDRVGRRVFLTPAGRDLLERSYAVRKGMDSLTSRASELASGTQGTLRLGATPQTLESLVARILPEFMQKHPDLGITLVEDGSARLTETVERGDIDLGVGALVAERGLKSRALFPLVALVALPDGHALARRKGVEIADLAEEHVLLLRKEFMTRQLFDGACQVAHVAPRVILESASPHCLLALVQAGLGVAIIPSTVRMAKGHPTVRPLTQKGRQLGLWMHAIWDPRRYTPPAVTNFIDALARHTEHDYPGKSFRIGNLLSMR